VKPPRDRVVAAPLHEVSLSVQDSLKAKGFAAEVSEQDNVIRVAGQATKGRFAFVLTGVKTAYGEKTRVRIDWERSEDAKANPALAQIVTDLELSAAKKANS
jgi:hypothetical protein